MSSWLPAPSSRPGLGNPEMHVRGPQSVALRHLPAALGIGGLQPRDVVGNAAPWRRLSALRISPGLELQNHRFRPVYKVDTVSITSRREMESRGGSMIGSVIPGLGS